MGELKDQHEDVLEHFKDHFEGFLDDEDIRWDKIIVEGRNSDDIGYLPLEVDIALINENDSEAYFLEIKTTSAETVLEKGEDQINEITSHFENEGYEAWGARILVERYEHMDQEDMVFAIQDNLGGVFDRQDIADIIEYKNSWGSFGTIKSYNWLSINLSSLEEPDILFHQDASYLDLRLLEERGVMKSEVEDVYCFTEEYKKQIENGSEDSLFMLHPKAYSTYDI